MSQSFIEVYSRPFPPSEIEARGQRRAAALARVSVPVVGVSTEDLRTRRETFAARMLRNLGPEGQRKFREWEARQQSGRAGGHSSFSLLTSGERPAYPK